MSLFQEIGYICTNPRTIAGETKDCTVRALCHAADISYEEAHAALKAHGRKDRKGCYPSHFIPAYEKFGFKRLPVKYNSMTAGAFMEANPTGSFILTIAGHAFAYVNGRQIDNVNVLFARRKLLMAFARVEEVKPLPEIKTTDDARELLQALRDYARAMKNDGIGICDIIRGTTIKFQHASNRLIKHALIAELGLNPGTCYRQIGEARKILARQG